MNKFARTIYAISFAAALVSAFGANGSTTRAQEPLLWTQVCKPFACNKGFQSMIAVSSLGSVTVMTCVQTNGVSDLSIGRKAC